MTSIRAAACAVAPATGTTGRWTTGVLLIVLLVVPEMSWGQDGRHYDPLRFVTWPVTDVRAMAEAVQGRGTLAVLGASAAVYAIAQRDPGLREAILEASPEPNNLFVRVVDELGNVHAVRPAAFMLFLGSLTSGDGHLQNAAYTSLESIVFANLLTNTLKGVFGRARPYQNEGSSHFNPFSGNTSFPSGHATTAFALTTPWFLYYPGPVTAGLMVLSTGTAVARVIRNVHWVSDVVAGSTIGFVTAAVLTRAHSESSSVLSVSPVVGPDGGAGFTVRVRP